MQKWKKTGSLPQLALNDNSDLRETFMYRLSLTNGKQYHFLGVLGGDARKASVGSSGFTVDNNSNEQQAETAQ